METKAPRQSCAVCGFLREAGELSSYAVPRNRLEPLRVATASDWEINCVCVFCEAAIVSEHFNRTHQVAMGIPKGESVSQGEKPAENKDLTG